VPTRRACAPGIFDVTLALAAIGGGIASVGAVVTFVRRREVLFGLLVVFLIAQPTLDTFVSGAFGPAKDVVVILVGIGTVAGLAVNRGPSPFARDVWLFGATALLLAMYVVDPAGPHNAAWANDMRLALESFGLFLMAMLSPNPERNWRAISMGLVVGATLSAIWGLIQQEIGFRSLVLKFGYTYGSQVRQTASGQFRSFGLLQDPFNYVTVCLLALAVLLFTRRFARWRWPLFAVIAAGAFTAWVRTADVILVLLVLLALARSGRRQWAAAGVVMIGVAGLAYLVASGTTSASTTTTGMPTGGIGVLLTLDGRTSTWAHDIPNLGALLVGQGVGQIGSGAARTVAGALGTSALGSKAVGVLTQQQFLQYNIDSIYLGTIVDVGLLGLLLLLWVFSRVVVLARRATARGSEYGWAALALLLVMVTDGLTRSSLTAFPVGYIGLLSIGAATAAAVEPGRIQGSVTKRQHRPRGAWTSGGANAPRARRAHAS
jgi:hypothetical protein